ncbi:MAG TPA: PadR family transcriptional regulator [Candidatus Saccharimonadales bacterium]|nr:PadR family transcriptional regulator [Candidatus Saccharimonadales bacterium]
MPRKHDDADHFCCDMRGMLSFMLLWLLSKRAMYGQELADEIAKRKGEKPNPGTIYPALKDLKNRHLIQVRVQGRKTVYELTREGRTGVTEATIYFTRAFGEIFEEPIHRRRQS